MDLKNYLNILWRRKWIIVLTTIATITVAVIGTNSITPMYQSSTTIRIAASAIDTTYYENYIYNERLMNTYAEIVTSRPILDELTKQLNLSRMPSITVEVIPGTELIKITTEDASPKMAATAANTLANILVTQSAALYIGGEKKPQEVIFDQLSKARIELDQTREDYEKLIIQTPPVPESMEATRQLLDIQQNNYAMLLSQYDEAHFREEVRATMITVIEPAIVPQNPSSPNTSLNYMLGLVVGLLGGLVMGLVFENLDSTLYTTEDIEKTAGINTMAKLPYANKKKFDISQNSDSPLADAFRKIVTGIQAIDPKRQKKVLLVMSPEPQQGVSMIVSNLAYALSNYDKNVIAIDCNLRHPGLHSRFGLSNENGLADVLERKIDLDQAIHDGPNDCLHVLTTGIVSAHPSQLIASVEMTKLINDLGKSFDITLMDTPALLAVADIHTLAQQADGLILVVRRAHVQRESLRETMKFLEGYQAKFIGLIINEAEANNHYSFYKRAPKFV